MWPFGKKQKLVVEEQVVPIVGVPDVYKIKEILIRRYINPDRYILLDYSHRYYDIANTEPSSLNILWSDNLISYNGVQWFIGIGKFDYDSIFMWFCKEKLPKGTDFDKLDKGLWELDECAFINKNLELVETCLQEISQKLEVVHQEEEKKRVCHEKCRKELWEKVNNNKII
jgi:hypothetical protein